MSPFMPFVTEELYQRLPHRKSDKSISITVAQFPFNLPWADPELDDKFACVQARDFLKAACPFLLDAAFVSRTKGTGA
eukprot:m.323580 g.323580  ORF g.323580 m.323580 type:complete len:78 (-) comp19726_c0_seq11:27-260(-)